MADCLWVNNLSACLSGHRIKESKLVNMSFFCACKLLVWVSKPLGRLDDPSSCLEDVSPVVQMVDMIV